MTQSRSCTHVHVTTIHMNMHIHLPKHFGRAGVTLLAVVGGSHCCSLYRASGPQARAKARARVLPGKNEALERLAPALALA